MSRNVSQETIAQTVGLSKNAVSLALAGKPGVSDETRERVVAAAHQLGYRKPSVRKARRTQAKTVGIVVRATFIQDKFFFGPLLTFLQHHIAMKGMNTVVHALDPVAEHDQAHPPWLDSPSLEGILAVSKISTDYLRKLGETNPLVLVDHYDPLVKADAVLTANIVGGYVATTYLSSLGHQNIGFMGLLDAHGAPSNHERAFGYQRALASVHGGGAQIVTISDETDTKAMSQHLDALAVQPTAWFCANDIVAFHLVRCLRERGTEVPGEVSVVGFDDLPLAVLCDPPLTTLRVDPALFASRAVDRLMWRLAHLEAPREHLSLHPEFVNRCTTAPKT